MVQRVRHPNPEVEIIRSKPKHIFHLCGDSEDNRASCENDNEYKYNLNRLRSDTAFSVRYFPYLLHA